MPAAKIDLTFLSEPVTGSILNLSIEQGTTYRLPLSISGDWTAGTFRSEIRNNYANLDLDEEGAQKPALASFNIVGVTYDDITDPLNPVTNFVLELPEPITKDLPLTLNVPDTRRSAINQGYKVYDLEYDDTGNVLRIIEGFVEIKPETTTKTT